MPAFPICQLRPGMSLPNSSTSIRVIEYLTSVYCTPGVVVTLDRAPSDRMTQYRFDLGHVFEYVGVRVEDLEVGDLVTTGRHRGVVTNVERLSSMYFPTPAARITLNATAAAIFNLDEVVQVHARGINPGVRKVAYFRTLGAAMRRGDVRVPR